MTDRTRQQEELTSDETASMNKDTPRNARLLGQHVVPQTAPNLRQGLATFKALRGHWHSLTPPLLAQGEAGPGQQPAVPPGAEEEVSDYRGRS